MFNEKEKPMKYLIMFGPAALIFICVAIGWILYLRREQNRPSDGIMHDGETE